jgi:hypothetical protein
VTRPLGPLAFVLAGMAIFAAGCGQSDKDKAKSAVQTYIDGLASGDGKKVCDQLAPSVQARIKTGQHAKDCASAISSYAKTKQGSAIGPAFKTAKIQSVELKGKSGVATVSLPLLGQPTSIPLEKSGDTWRIASVGP